MPVAVVPSRFEPEQVETPAQREQRTVHDVYEQIAPHFSATRYKPWPVISRFLSEVPPGSLGLDSGAGNGKYLPVLRTSSEGSVMVALDRSLGLLEFARTQTGSVEGKGKGKEEDKEEAPSVVEECVRADLCFNGWRSGVFDFAISIAAIHHLSTPSRRVDSVRSLIRPLRVSRPDAQGRCARFLIYVWAFEQGENSKRKMGVLAPAQTTQEGSQTEEQSAPASGEVDKDVRQDVMVPWVLQPKPVPKPKAPKGSQKRDARRRAEGPAGESPPIPEASTSTTSAQAPQPANPPPPQVFHRYYHLFMQGELSTLVHDAGRAEGFDLVESPSKPMDGKAGGKWLRVVDEGYEKDNWWLEGEVGLY
ncbi:hypothetical protein NliqN6_1622 [Naganishia liquefaciens]|uniref:Methyltransferase type 11 domain-containing protein n=1 Tax=Naganishia liquefaciens TaxID=104408 RepID=A0A8H3TQ95_9TREE|nr:hypothetical protein NliqN6_1622 [Naganishia liquefaciens]